MVNTMTTKKSFMPDIAILRTLCIVVVVMFHVIGMTYEGNHFPLTQLQYRSIYSNFNNCIINIAMPMFVFISGYLFFFQLQENKFQTLFQLLKKKGMRILIPYFIFGLVMMATTGNFHPLELLHGGYWHLWFLPMLFWCFLISYFLKDIRNKWIVLTIILAAFSVSLCGKFLPRIMGLHNITIWYCWFLLGGGIFTHQDAIVKILTKYKISVLLPIVYIVLIIWCPTEYGDVTWQYLVSSSCIVVFLWYLFHILPQNIIKFFNPIMNFSQYSYGIYIFHNWMALYLISNTAQRILNLPSIAQEHIILFPLSFFVVTMFVSFLLSALLLRTRFGRFLIG